MGKGPTTLGHTTNAGIPPAGAIMCNDTEMLESFKEHFNPDEEDL